MLILSVDTALGQESCAIIKDGEVVAFSQGTENSLQAERLFEHINNVLAETNLKYDDFEYFAVDLGPGSFTGIRIGLSAILAIGLAQNKKVVGISSLEALANKLSESGATRISSAINAGREQAYYQEFNLQSGLLSEYSNPELIDVNKLIFADIGNVDECKITSLPDARDIGLLAHKLIINDNADFERKSPIYVRKPDAKINVQ